MATEVQPTPPHENGSKIEESSSTGTPSDTVTNGKETPKTPPQVVAARETRSRSKTPQKKKEKKIDTDTPSDIIRNGKEALKTPPQVVAARETRSRSRTPQKKKERKINGHEEKRSSRSSSVKSNNEFSDASSINGVSEEYDAKDQNETAKKDELRKSPRKPLKSLEQIDEVDTKRKEAETVECELKTAEVEKPENDAVEMDALILATDEPDPELQFDENSDMESGKSTPIQVRCKTRRSLSRNVPTPKTPKSATDSESEKNSVAPTPTPENLSETIDSFNSANISTRVQVGSDVSRLDYVANSTPLVSDDSGYSNASRENKSLRESLRALTPRKTIHPLNDSYRQKAFRNTITKSDLNQPYYSEDSVDRVIGLKRKRSETPEERKKFKADGSGFMSYLTSPLYRLKSKFISEEGSSTPKLTGYKDSSNDIHEEKCFDLVPVQEKKNLCALM